MYIYIMHTDITEDNSRREIIDALRCINLELHKSRLRASLGANCFQDAGLKRVCGWLSAKWL
jgi:hypothetical protein